MQVFDTEIISRKNENPALVKYWWLICIGCLATIVGLAFSPFAVAIALPIMIIIGGTFLINEFHGISSPTYRVGKLLGYGSKIYNLDFVIASLQYLKYDVEVVKDAIIVNKTNLVVVKEYASKADFDNACDLKSKHGCDRIIFIKDEFYGKFVSEKDIEEKFNVEFYTFNDVAHTVYGKAKKECSLL